MSDPTADLTTVAMTVRLSDGSLRRLCPGDPTRAEVIGLLACAGLAVGAVRLNRTVEKVVVVRPGVPLHLVGAAVDAFLGELEAHPVEHREGPQRGVLLSFAEEGLSGELTLYVYQTARQIVVMR